jgi:hypothetical protein
MAGIQQVFPDDGQFKVTPNSLRIGLGFETAVVVLLVLGRQTSEIVRSICGG